MADEQILEHPNPEPELRYQELRAESDSREIYGLLVPYNVETNVGGLFREMALPGVFGDVEALQAFMTRQHKRELTLGRTGRNITLIDTDGGLQMRATMPKTPLGEDTLTLVRDGILTGLSVEWLVRREKWSGAGSPKLEDNCNKRAEALLRGGPTGVREHPCECPREGFPRGTG